MEPHITDILRACSKDEESLNRLHNLYSKLTQEADTYKNWLDILERTVQQDYDSILVTDLNLAEPGPTVIYVNEEFTRMTGYTREDIIGKSPRILQGPNTEQEVLEQMKVRLMEGKSFFGKTVNYRKDGSKFVNQWDIHPLYDGQGTITHWVSFQHDVSEREHLEQRWVDVGMDMNDLREESRSILVDVDASGRIRSSNKAFQVFSGYSSEELKSVQIQDLVIGENSRVFENLVHSAGSGDRNKRIGGIRLKTRNGNDVEVTAEAHILRSDDGGIIRVFFENRSLQRKIIEKLQSGNLLSLV